jgi:hypothetical protein
MLRWIGLSEDDVRLGAGGALFSATRSEIAFHLGKRSLIFNELQNTSS